MPLTNRGIAYLAASFLTSQRQAEIAADYEAWIDDQAVEDDAIDALLAASRSSKNPDKVLANAAAIYDGFDVTPTVASMAPNTGPAAGSTATVLTGLNLTGATGVTFDGTPGTAFSVVNDTTINVTTPAHAAGAVNVVVAHPAGNVTKTNFYTYT